MSAKPEYKHQCRYCTWCIFTMHETYWCDKLDKDLKGVRRPNKCNKFLFNPCPADAPDWSKEYKPRKKSPYKQDKLFDMPTDKQKERMKQCND